MTTTPEPASGTELGDGIDSTTRTLLHYLQRGREALLFKLEGLSEYDRRRPLTRTGSNLLGLVKHTASVEAGYLGDCFGRPFPETFAHFADEAPDNADFVVLAHESSDDIIALYHRVWAHSDATVLSVPALSTGEVDWWPAEHRHPSLQAVLIHVATETHRHAGQMDILRESIDGAAGMHPEFSNLPEHDAQWWADYREHLETLAQQADPDGAAAARSRAQ